MENRKMSSKTTLQSKDSEMDRFIKESCRSFKECNIKNNARRNSLQKKTLGIESERKLASANLSREERQLREQLKLMKIEKMKNNIVHNLREHNTKKSKKLATKDEPHAIPIEPYPVTFRTHTPPTIDLDKRLHKDGKLYAMHRGRRQSKEFEDLSLNTRSGKLLPTESEGDDDLPRRRTYSMSHALKQRSHTLLLPHSSRSGSSSPKTSPDLRRRVCTPKGGVNRKEHSSSNSSKESLSENENINSLDDLHWVGEPEAIHSVRRPRRTVEEQEIESEIHKLRNT